MSLNTTRGKKFVLEWCQVIGGAYGLEVTDLFESMKDGLVFCAIVHKFVENSGIDFSSLSKENGKENLELASKTASDNGVEVAFDSSDSEDQQAVFQFLSALFKKFNPDSPAIKKKNRKGRGGDKTEDEVVSTETTGNDETKTTEVKPDEVKSEEEKTTETEEVTKEIEPEVVSTEVETETKVEGSTTPTNDDSKSGENSPQSARSDDSSSSQGKKRRSRRDKKSKQSEPEPEPEVKEPEPEVIVKEDAPLIIPETVKEEEVDETKEVEEVKEPESQPEPEVVKESEPEVVKESEPEPEVKEPEVQPEPEKVEVAVEPETVKEPEPEPIKEEVKEEIKEKVKKTKKGKQVETKKLEPEPEKPSPVKKVEEYVSSVKETIFEDKPIKTEEEIEKKYTKPTHMPKEEDSEDIDIDDLLAENIQKIRKKRKKNISTGVEGEDAETVEDALRDALSRIDALEVELDLKSGELSKSKKRTTTFQGEVKKLISENTSLTQEVRNATSRLELEERARKDLQNRSDTEIQKLDSELAGLRELYEKEMSEKKTNEKQVKRSLRESRNAQEKADREEKRAIQLEQELKKVHSNFEEINQKYYDETAKLEGANREISDLVLSIDAYKKILDKTKKELDSTQQKYEELEISYDQFLSEIEDERLDREASEEQVEKLIIQVDKLKKGAIQLKKQKEESESNCVDYKRIINDLKFQVESEKQNFLKEERDKRLTVERMKEEIRKLESNDDEFLSLQRVLKKRERDVEKYKSKLIEQVDQKKILEREIQELRDDLNRTKESKNVLDDQLHQAHQEKDDVMKKLKEMEIYQQINQ